MKDFEFRGIIFILVYVGRLLRRSADLKIPVLAKKIHFVKVTVVWWEHLTSGRNPAKLKLPGLGARSFLDKNLKTLNLRAL